MNRDRSRSRLSSAGSRTKLKQTICDAMGRTQGKPTSPARPRRSESTKSLRSFNGSMINSVAPYGYSASNRKTIQNQLIASKVRLNQKSVIHATIKSWQWWHQNNAKLITHQKIKDNKGVKETLKYFALQELANSKKKIILAAQSTPLKNADNQIFPAYPQLQLLIIEKSSLRVEEKTKTDVVRVSSEKQQYLLFFQQNTSEVKKSVKYILQDELKVKKRKLESLFDYLVKLTIEGVIEAKFLLFIDFSFQDDRKKPRKLQTLQEVLKSDKLHKKLF